MTPAIVLAALLSSAAPPPEYDRIPTIDLEVLEMSHAVIQAYCSPAVAGMVVPQGMRIVIEACAVVGWDYCIVAWPEGRPREGLAWRHEMAHCNGWLH